MRFASGSRCPLVAQTQLEDVADSLRWRSGWHTNRARGAFTVSWKRLAPVPHTQGSETRAPAACPRARTAKKLETGNLKWIFNLQHGSWQEYRSGDINSQAWQHHLNHISLSLHTRFCEINCWGGKKKTFSNHKGWSNKRPTCLKELNVLFLWGLCKPFIKVKQSCRTPVVLAWGYLLLAYVSTL